MGALDMLKQADSGLDILDQKLSNADGSGKAANFEKMIKKQKKNTASIVARAKNSTFYFSIYISQSVNLSTATALSRVYDRVYATFVQTVLSNKKTLTLDEVEDMKFIKQIHSNNTTGPDISVKKILGLESVYNEHYEPIDGFDEMMQESLYHELQINENVSVRFTITKPPQAIQMESQRGVTDYNDGFPYLEATKEELEERKDRREEEKNKREADREEREKARDAREKSRDARDRDKFSRERRMDNQSYVRGVQAPVMLKDKDIKKINSMDPYTINATFIIKKPSSSAKPGVADEITNVEVNFILAVKTVLHVVKPADLAEELQGLISGNVKKLQKIRYKSGETRFWRDYVFDMKSIKSDATASITGKNWIANLKQLAKYQKTYGTALDNVQRFITQSDVPIPNATLILSSNDINVLKDETGIDLTDVSMAKMLASNLFLISIAIVDSTAETVKVLFPQADSNWDIQSLTSLEGEAGKVDNTIMREINKAIAR